MEQRLKMMYGYGVDLDNRIIYIDRSIGSAPVMVNEDSEDIDHEISSSHIAKLTRLLDDGTRPITFEITSEGGSFYEGIGIYYTIRNCKSPTITHVKGYAMSMAAVILQAGDVRVADKHSTIMIHDGQDNVWGTPSDVESWAKYSKKMCKVMYSIFHEKSTKTAKYWQKKCQSDYILTADEALAQGLLDKIV